MGIDCCSGTQVRVGGRLSEDSIDPWGADGGFRVRIASAVTGIFAERGERRHTWIVNGKPK
jgi:hypothetical protein